MTGLSVNFLGIDRCFAEHQENLCSIYKDIGSTGQVVGGSHVSLFEENCGQIANRNYSVSVANASDGLYLALLASGIGPGNEVLTTAYSFFATAESISRTGATPIFVDVDDHYHLDLNKAKDKISPRTCAIVVVNLFGNCMDFDEVTAFAKENNLMLFEDAAQSLFSKWKNTPSGNLGVASVYSFAPSKNIPGFSHGGCVVTDNEELAQQIRILKLHGKVNGQHIAIGYNSIMSSFEAAQINYFLNFADVWQNRRTQIADYYISELNGLVTLPTTRNGATHSWHKFVIACGARNNIRKKLLEHGVETGVHYTTIIPHEPIYQEQRFKTFNNTRSYPKAEALANSSLSLPIYPELTDIEVEYIVKCLRTSL